VCGCPLNGVVECGYLWGLIHDLHTKVTLPKRERNKDNLLIAAEGVLIHRLARLSLV
jgi:hypothetical protein